LPPRFSRIATWLLAAGQRDDADNTWPIFDPMAITNVRTSNQLMTAASVEARPAFLSFIPI
jgi:hypothetical protein